MRIGVRGPSVPGGRAPLASWTPASLTNAVLWLRADLGVTLSGSDVTTWANQISGGDGSDATGPAGDRPLFVSGGGPNSQDAIEFDGANTEHFTGTITGSSAGDSWSVAMVVYFDDLSNRAVWDQSDTTATNRCILDFASGTVDNWRAGNGATTKTATGTVSATTWLSLTGTHVTASRTIYNSNVALTGGTNPESSSQSVNAAANYRIGRLFGALFHMSGRVAEIVVCRTEWTSDERTSLDSYFNTRYGL